MIHDRSVVTFNLPKGLHSATVNPMDIRIISVRSFQPGMNGLAFSDAV
jgi:hypothetical protein